MNGYRYGAELGVAEGRFTSFLCGMIPDLKMIAVDLWEELPERPGMQGAETYKKWKLEDKFTKFKEGAEKFFSGRIEIRRQHTLEAAKTIHDESLDFVFIDAGHSYEDCLADIEAWTPKVKPGGLISGHDYNEKWPGVIRAVSETGTANLSHDSVWMRLKP